MTRRALLFCAVAALALTAGCVGGDTATPTPTPTDVSTPTPTPQSVLTPTDSPTSTPSPSPTPTPTPTATPTPTPTATPTPTPIPTPETETVGIGSWAYTTHNDTDVNIRVRRYQVSETVEKSGGGTEEASDGKQFIVATVEISSRPGDEVRVGRDQWTLVDWTGERHGHAGVTSDVSEPFPEEKVLLGDGVEGTIVWEVERTTDPEFEAVPYGDQPGGTVRVVTD